MSPDQPDDRDLDEGGLDLTPRAGATPARARTAGRRWLSLGVLVLLVGVVGFVLVQARGATLYFKNADEAVAQKADLGTDRFRLQGVVVGEPERLDHATNFTVAYQGVSVDVIHTGSEPALFKEGLPIVAEGAWHSDGTHFASDRLLVKHTEDYKKADDGNYDDEHPDRVPEELPT